MQFKENLNASYTSHLTTIGMHEYNQSLGNPKKKALRGSKFEIHGQFAGGGQGA
jgi:hypothetical protein